MSDVMSIGRYQLENLLRAGIGFTFLDLRTPVEAGQMLDPEKAKLLGKTKAMGADEILADLQAQNAPLDTAIILICEDGVKSKGVSLQLEEAGFKNVYRVEGGVAAL